MNTIMEDLKKGIVNVDGVEINPETTMQDVENIGVDKAVQRFHPGEFLELIFNHPIEYDGVAFTVSIRISPKDNRKVVHLDPKLNMQASSIKDESRMKQEVCEDWLKRNFDTPPTRDTEEGIIYEFDWGSLFSAATEHIHFGHVNGCIHLVYGDFGR